MFWSAVRWKSDTSSIQQLFHTVPPCLVGGWTRDVGLQHGSMFPKHRNQNWCDAKDMSRECLWSQQTATWPFLEKQFRLMVLVKDKAVCDLFGTAVYILCIFTADPQVVIAFPWSKHQQFGHAFLCSGFVCWDQCQDFTIRHQTIDSKSLRILWFLRWNDPGRQVLDKVTSTSLS